MTRHRTHVAVVAALLCLIPIAVSGQGVKQPACPAPATGVACKGACAPLQAGAACDKSTGAPLCGVSGASCGAIASAAFDPAVNARNDGAATTADDLGIENLNAVLEPVRARYRVPALAIAVARSDGVIAAGAVGVRVAGASDVVTPVDRFHLGSCGKSITASVAARLVELGNIDWDTTVGETFTDLPETATSVYRTATLEQLLAHRSGMPPRDDAVMATARSFDGDARAQREQFVRMALQLPAVADPDFAFVYTDVGYTVAGAMLERAAGKPWETLVVEYVAGPLELTTLGFGEPATLGSMSQPWGHVADGGRTVPFSPGPFADIDNPAVIAPAGLVHLSIVDWAVFASEQLKGARGLESVMLSPGSYRHLHGDMKQQGYGLGWGVGQGAHGRVLSHTGSCGEWFSAITVLPERDLAIVVATNISGGNGVAACNDALLAAQDRFLAGAPAAAQR